MTSKDRRPTTKSAVSALRRAPARFWVLIAVFFGGIASCLILPPFEGFDETAHYASVQYVAETGRPPVYGDATYGADLVRYLARAPQPYGSLAPFDENGGLTYARVFADEMTTAELRAALEDAPSRAYAPAGPINWQAQHPPLAYFALAPVYLATEQLSWKSHVFWLRAVSWSVAFAGLFIGVEATRRYLDRRHDGAEGVPGALMAPSMIAALWPFLIPQFFPEMARLGNDSFCLFFAGLLWALLLRVTADNAPVSLKTYIGIGVVLGAGALVKAFFLPVAAGVVLILALRACAAMNWRFANVSALALALAPAMATGFVFALIAGGWYVYKLLWFGALTGSNDMIVLQQSGGLLALLVENFSIFDYAKKLISIYLSFIWAGTWSLVKPPLNAHILIALVFAILGAAWLFRLLRERNWTGVEAAPIFIVGPVVAGLGYHALTQAALGPAGIGTPGWYLHIFAAPLAFAAALGVREIANMKWGAIFLGASAFYAIVFGFVATRLQMTLFAGCAVKGRESRVYEALTCFNDVSEIWSRLDVIAYPGLALLFAMLALAALALSTAKIIRQ